MHYGFDMKDACDFGNVLGGLVAGQKGATQPIINSDIENFNKYLRPNSIIQEFKDFLIT